MGRKGTGGRSKYTFDEFWELKESAQTLDLDGKKPAEIAHIWGCSPSYIRNVLNGYEPIYYKGE